MTEKIPRIMLAAVSSGCGKTTLTCGILQALVNRKLNPVCFKCGPDYIDPMFHTKVIGTKSRNVDLFFTDENTAKALLCKNAHTSDITVLEGVMGYYDGVGGSQTASSYHLASATKTPVVLVVSPKGQSLTLSAVIKGIKDFRADSNIKGVILNYCSAAQYISLKAQIEKETGLTVLGYLPAAEQFVFSSRHLGLVTADEIDDIKEKLEELGRQIEQTVDLDSLIAMAEVAPPLEYTPLPLAKAVHNSPLIAVARDKAFCFYYEDNLDLLKALGADIIFFSPLEDKALPEGTSGIYLGGGYPELYAEQLSRNKGMLECIKAAITSGMPAIAECGGFMYLQETLQGDDGEIYPMVGAINGRSIKTKKLQRFGYCELTARQDNLLFKKGESISAHEFHYWDSSDCGESFIAKKSGKDMSWPCIHATSSLFAGYPHLYFYANPIFAQNFAARCASFKEDKYAKGKASRD